MKYGTLPIDMGLIELAPKEVCYYLYLPLSMPNQSGYLRPRRLAFCDPIIEAIATGPDRGRFYQEHVYITVKRMFVGGGVTPNRPGWHADGFGTDDINYVWYDCVPTIFNNSEFVITNDHHKSLEEFSAQALPVNDRVYPDRHLLRLDQSCVHRVGEIERQVMRTFIKVSISKSRYNLEDNSHNYEIDYRWPMFSRSEVRNDPHKAQQDSATPQSKFVSPDDHFI